MVIKDGMNVFERAIKRLFDVLCSFFGLLVLSPVFLIVYIRLRIQNDGSVIFRQERIGYKGKPFNIFKFRTMRADS
ncbi:MAG: sugar transferase, partial [Bacteroidaceae bacterium]|nr:sugar transferase [Bacteroidaceae bacterium]